MTKSDLTRAVTAHNDITLQKAEENVNLFFAQTAEALSEGDRVKIRGFGSLSVRGNDSYIGSNPRTGEVLEVKPKKLPFFKPCVDSPIRAISLLV